MHGCTITVIFSPVPIDILKHSSFIMMTLLSVNDIFNSCTCLGVFSDVVTVKKACPSLYYFILLPF